MEKEEFDNVFGWDKTQRVYLRISSNNFNNRFIISRNTPVINGVYLSSHPKEAIVVEKNKVLEQTYKKAKKLSYLNDGFYEDQILFAVHHVVEDIFKKNNLEKYKDFISRRNLKNDKEVGLESFVENEIGICKQRALLSTYLLERFKEEGYINGIARVNRNGPKFSRTGHAWCRYTKENGETIIIDPIVLKKPEKIKDTNIWYYSKFEEAF